MGLQLYTLPDVRQHERHKSAQFLEAHQALLWLRKPALSFQEIDLNNRTKRIKTLKL